MVYGTHAELGEQATISTVAVEVVGGVAVGVAVHGAMGVAGIVIFNGRNSDNGTPKLEPLPSLSNKICHQ